MKIQLGIQDPSDGSMPYVFDAIVRAANGAKRGYAIFAFATEAGVDLLLNHDSIQTLSNTGLFEVIVGIDAITNRQTLEKLREASHQRPGLRPKVFWNTTGGIFHPKLCHFQSAHRDTWIIGSGNLTPRGLRDNYEAFTLIEGKSSELTNFNVIFHRFLDSHASDIREIDDEALKRASKNTFTQSVGEIEAPEHRTVQKHFRTPKSGVLIAELPRGGGRWQQANFDVATTRDFFGVERTPNSLRTTLFFNEVDSTGASVSEEVRHFTYTRSKNLRVQLAAKNGTDYPKKGRPIAIIGYVKPRHFVYQLLLPGNKGFAILKGVLDRQASGKVRRHITELGKVRAVWPKCPLG